MALYPDLNALTDLSELVQVRFPDEVITKRLRKRVNDALVRAEFGGRMNDTHRAIVPSRRILRCNCITP